MENQVERLEILQANAANRPGLKLLLDAYSREVFPCDRPKFILADWLKRKGFNLTRSQKVRFSNQVAHLYRLIYHRKPEVYRAKDNSAKGNLYDNGDEPLIIASFLCCFCDIESPDGG